MSYKEIDRGAYKVKVEAPEIYVDNEKRGRSGHMTHAFAHLKDGKYIEFNSNCSATRCGGHSAFGWVEYRIGSNGGKTYSEVYDLEYSKEVLLGGDHAISVEKAVTTDTGRIVAFCLRNSSMGCCEPWSTMTYITSDDEGKTWSEAKELSKEAGRVYDALYHDGVIYAVQFCNSDFLGTNPLNVYRLYKSTDNGETFTEVSVLPLSGINRSYCTIFFDEDSALHIYTYNYSQECYMDHAISYDNGANWTILPPAYFAKGIRNPQSNYIDGVYFIHGRGAMTSPGFVLYTSANGYEWDEGEFLNDKKTWYAHYSNNIVLEDEKGKFVLIQYSDIYGKEDKSPNEFAVNCNHIKFRIEK